MSKRGACAELRSNKLHYGCNLQNALGYPHIIGISTKVSLAFSMFCVNLDMICALKFHTNRGAIELGISSKGTRRQIWRIRELREDCF